MAGLLPVETSFAGRSLHLGYRRIVLCGDSPIGPAGTRFRGHEFHYARVLAEGSGSRLFACENAAGEAMGTAGLAVGWVCGSFVHLIDREA
jgi:cobyrinic acid a,c-diamide synthase